MKRLGLLLAVALAWGAFLVQGASAAPTQTATYTASGTYTPGGEGGAPAYNYSGNLTCTSNYPPDAQTGSFTINLGATKLWPPDPVIAQKADGVFSITWADGTITSGDLQAHNIDHKGYALDGQITTSTNPFLPPDPIKGFVTFPPQPVLPGFFGGTLQLQYPPEPV